MPHKVSPATTVCVTLAICAAGNGVLSDTSSSAGLATLEVLGGDATALRKGAVATDVGAGMRPVGAPRNWLRTTAAVMTAETRPAAALWRPRGRRRCPDGVRTRETAVARTEKTK